MTDPQKPYGRPVVESDGPEIEAGAIEPALMAAYLDGDLPEDKKLELQRIFATSPAAMAELISAIDLLEETEGSTLRPPEAVQAKARAILAEYTKMAALPAQAQARSWFAMPWFRFAAGLAAVAIVAVIVFRSQSPVPGQSSGPSLASNPSDSGSKSALLPGQAGIPNDVSRPGGQWGALAVSKSTRAYGIAQRAGSRGEAVKAALADCVARQGTDCAVVQAGAGQCFALAGQIDGPPVTAAAADVQTARKRALDACTIARREIFPCTVLSAFCAEK